MAEGGEKLIGNKSGSTLSVLMGAAFLMATSAIGPGFLTQTAVFTDQLKAAFAFAIVVSILIDIVVQVLFSDNTGINDAVRPGKSNVTAYCSAHKCKNRRPVDR